MRRTILIGLVLAAGLAACAGPRRAAPVSTCGEDPVAHCDASCGTHGGNARDTPERRCEGFVADLCRAHCLEDCGDRSEALAKRIAQDEAKLDRGCGSGQSIEPGELPPDHHRPTPNPLNELLL